MGNGTEELRGICIEMDGVISFGNCSNIDSRNGGSLVRPVSGVTRLGSGCSARDMDGISGICPEYSKDG